MLVLGLWNTAQAQEYKFDASLLGAEAKNVDMSLFDQGLQQPGSYLLDIFLNGDQVDSRDVELKLGHEGAGHAALEPCITVKQLYRYGVKTESYPGLLPAPAGQAEVADDNACVNLSAIPQATAKVQGGLTQLDLSIPQVALRTKIRGVAPRTLWDDGIPAFVLNYSANSQHTDFRGGQNNSSFVQLNPGINWGAWRLRNSSAWRQGSGRPGTWQTAYSYGERGLYDYRSRLTLGDKSTPGEVFDSVPFRGVMLNTDELMIPYSQRTFAPVVRGIARSQARVEVKQNGYSIYSTTVAPGPFDLNDLNVTDSGGDLEVTVWESDGQPQVFIVPFQTAAIAVHRGYFNYDVMAGQYRPSDDQVDRLPIVQGTLIYGLPWNLTIYGGGQAAKHYNAASVGLGASLGRWGGVSLDMTQAQGQRFGKPAEQGSSWRVRYSNELQATGTTLSVVGYQYATPGYRSLAEVLDTYRDSNRCFSDCVDYLDTDLQRKSRLAITLIQQAGRWGSFSLSGSRTYYRDTSGYDEYIGFGYGTTLGSATVNFNFTQNRTQDRANRVSKDRILSLSLSMPLGRVLPETTASLRMTSPRQGAMDQQLDVNGQAFDRQLNWQVQNAYQKPESGASNDTIYTRLAWSGAHGRIGTNYTSGRDYRVLGFDVAGGVVVHSEGVTFGQTLGDTIALAQAPGAQGAGVNGWPGVRTDRRGFSTVSGLAPYQENTVTLDPSMVADNAEIVQTDVKVVPTMGAVVPARFSTRVGAKAIVKLSRLDGQRIPFAARVQVKDRQGEAGLVDAEGQVYLTGLPKTGSLSVRLSATEQCNVSYDLAKHRKSGGLYKFDAVCR